MSDQLKAPDRDYWAEYFGPSEGRMAWRSVPLTADGPPYWHAAALIKGSSRKLIEAKVALKDSLGEPRRLASLEEKLVNGSIADADAVLDTVRDMIECSDDSEGTAAAKSYMAGWICADVVGRCLK